MKHILTLLLLLFLVSIDINAQGLLTKQQGEYFYGFINSLPKNYGVTQDFADKLKAIHQKAFIYFEYNKKIKNLTTDNIYFTAKDGEVSKLKSNTFKEMPNGGSFTSCLVYPDDNTAYIVSYAKSIYQDRAIAVIWELQDGTVKNMQQGIVSLTKFSNGDNLIWHKFLFNKNMYFINEYTDLNSFILEDYEGSFDVK